MRGEFMRGDTFIGGVTMASGKAYCEKCNHVFVYHYNGCAGLLKGEGLCPKCRSENAVREDQVENQISILRSLIRSDITTDDQKKKMRSDISNLNKIRRLFDEYKG
jgi:hypothetical protein